LLHTEYKGKLVKEKYPSLPGNYGGYYKDLYNAIRKGEPLKVKPEHGFNVIRLIELATESSEKKSRVKCTGLINVPYN
jgi:predicted dehydrogenase